jgi:hypothetical protein
MNVWIFSWLITRYYRYKLRNIMMDTRELHYQECRYCLKKLGIPYYDIEAEKTERVSRVHKTGRTV